ncbi:YodL domain-containing protein [Novisyntrophococcus fermenticellae]|uniref:YodL domain-containing protein n=1 Tax=Novisyntrophococcus fermenticellae TaxID=2068655 RepID=UPI001E36CB08|nr:YodL domain-containing protein [Novisyntrophococcus fermenticellae]
MPYTSYDHDRLQPAENMRIERTISFRAGNGDTSGLTALPVEQLRAMRAESAAAEQVIYDKLREASAEWEAQAGQTQLFDKAIEYARTPTVKHTSNQWKKSEHNNDWQEMSNMVYSMSHHIYERTRYDRETEKSVPVAWELTWSIYTNPPQNLRRTKIAGHDKKVYSDRADMEKYLAGRIKAYSHLFTEISPSIPQGYANDFRVNGQLLPGYTVEGEEVQQPEHTADIPISGVSVSEHTEQRKEREHMGEVFSIYIGNVQNLSPDKPGGAWLGLPATREQLQEAIQILGITADQPQYLFIGGYDYPQDKSLSLPYDVINSSTVDELNFLAARIGQLDPAELKKFNAVAQGRKGFESIGQMIDFTYNTDFYVHIPDIHKAGDLGDYYLNKSGMVQMPEEWKAGIDTVALGIYVARKEQGEFVGNSYLVASGDQWERHYEGRDVPEQYRIMSYPQPPDPEKTDRDEISARQAATLTTEPTEPRPIIPLVLTSEKPAEKLKEITHRLEQGIQELFDSERYKEYLSVMSKFHNYSFNNTLLIAMQKSDASLIAGFSSWKNQFERNVKKGEKGIKIIAPSPFKIKKKMEKIDPSTQRPVIGKSGKPITEEVEVTIPAFKVVSVFDVSQTEGKELPDIAVDALTGDVEQYKDFFAALERTSPVPVGFEEMTGGTQGYYHLEDKRIVLLEGASQLQTLKTLIHEIAHAKLHDIDLTDPKEEQQNRPDRRTREVEAESIAYTVCQHYGLDTSDYSFGYVAGWSSGKELAELKSSLETIRSTAAELIDTIDGHIAEIQKGKEQTVEQEQRDTFSIYQLKRGDETRDYRFEPYERLQAAGLAVDPENYEHTYTAPLTPGMTLEHIFERFNIDRPEDFKGHSISISDMIVLHQSGKDTAHYVDRGGLFTKVPEFLQQEHPFDLQHITERLQKIHDNVMTADPNKTMGEAAYRMAIKRLDKLSGEISSEQEQIKELISFAAQSENLLILKERMTEVVNGFNPLAAAEKSTDQNFNMIDGIINNTPTVDELEAKVKAGGQINLSDLAAAIKADKERGGGKQEHKPSIRAQLAEDKKKATPKRDNKNKEPDLEKS